MFSKDLAKILKQIYSGVNPATLNNGSRSARKRINEYWQEAKSDASLSNAGMPEFVAYLEEERKFWQEDIERVHRVDEFFLTRSTFSESEKVAELIGTAGSNSKDMPTGHMRMGQLSSVHSDWQTRDAPSSKSAGTAGFLKSPNDYEATKAWKIEHAEQALEYIDEWIGKAAK